jgi:hypothetical protein
MADSAVARFGITMCTVLPLSFPVLPHLLPQWYFALYADTKQKELLKTKTIKKEQK